MTDPSSWNAHAVSKYSHGNTNYNDFARHLHWLVYNYSFVILKHTSAVSSTASLILTVSWVFLLSLHIKYEHHNTPFIFYICMCVLALNSWRICFENTLLTQTSRCRIRILYSGAVVWKLYLCCCGIEKKTESKGILFAVWTETLKGTVKGEWR